MTESDGMTGNVLENEGSGGMCPECCGICGECRNVMYYDG